MQGVRGTFSSHSFVEVSTLLVAAAAVGDDVGSDVVDTEGRAEGAAEVVELLVG